MILNVPAWLTSSPIQMRSCSTRATFGCVQGVTLDAAVARAVQLAGDVHLRPALAGQLEDQPGDLDLGRARRQLPDLHRLEPEPARPTFGMPLLADTAIPMAVRSAISRRSSSATAAGIV